MNPEIKKLWVEALRSNKFVQGKGTLKRRYIDGENKGRCEHCVLGVLCEIFAEKLEHPFCEVASRDSRIENYVSPHATDDDVDTCAVLPSNMVCEWAGIGNDIEPIKLGYEYVHLWKLNDMGYTFAQLADLIEAQL